MCELKKKITSSSNPCFGGAAKSGTGRPKGRNKRIVALSSPPGEMFGKS